jgi:hypothetical protein
MMMPARASGAQVFCWIGFARRSKDDVRIAFPARRAPRARPAQSYHAALPILMILY